MPWGAGRWGERFQTLRGVRHPSTARTSPQRPRATSWAKSREDGRGEVQAGAEDVSESSTAGQPPLLEVKELQKFFPIRKGFWKRTVGYVRAVDGVSFVLHEGETLGLVGESGCGKTTT